MRKISQRSTEITDIIGDVAKGIDCMIAVHDEYGVPRHIPCPPVNYVFGNPQYIKERLDELSKATDISRYPLIALKVPVTETKKNPRYQCSVKLEVLIACSSNKEWSNEQRAKTSFADILRPIYLEFIKRLKRDGRLDIAYSGQIPHDYSENYSYGRYGAYTPAGDKLPDPIDAINITNLELNIKLPNCSRI